MPISLVNKDTFRICWYSVNECQWFWNMRYYEEQVTIDTESKFILCFLFLCIDGSESAKQQLKGTISDAVAFRDVELDFHERRQASL